MKREITKFCISLLLAATMVRVLEATEEPIKPKIQVAVMLDTSGSMQGLINQARTQLWKIVNELATTRKNGVMPELQVSLFEYGNSRLSSGDGYIRQIVPLATDLDKVSEELFALKTEGGDEYCGMVIDVAVDSLKWDAGNATLKIIFIAGNEPFTQGKVDYKVACKQAVSKGIIVNTIFCGARLAGITGKWEDGADLADGKYLNINQNERVHHIAAPQDAEIRRLGAKLNMTYIAFGGKATEGLARQEKADRSAVLSAPAAAVERSVAKSSGHYKNAGWDLVDAVAEQKVNMAEVKKDELPAEMRNMDGEARALYIQNKSRERKELSKKIQELSEKRRSYIVTERKKLATNGQETLDSAMISAIREQAEAKGLVLKK